MICQVSEDRNDVIIRFTRVGSVLQEFMKSLHSLTGTASEGLSAIVYGLLGAYTKDAIDKFYRHVRKEDYSEAQFEAELGDMLDRYNMNFCASCGRPVRRTQSFCSHCGRAIQ